MLRLAIDTRGAKGLESLTAQICGRDERKLRPGQVARLEEKVEPGQDVAVFIRGTVPARARVGSSYTVNIEPKLGKVHLVGYSSELRVTSPHEYLSQLVDTLLAASVDLARAADLAPACRIASQVRQRFAGGCLTTETVAEMAIDLADDLGDAVAKLARRREGRGFCLESAFEEWKRALEGGRSAEIVEGLFALAQRLQMVAWALLNPR